MRTFASIIGTVVLALLLSNFTSAQQPFYPGFPGEPIHGYFQPVSIRTPEGTSLACISAGRFSERLPTPLQVGMHIGRDYRLRITDIPFHFGKELFPTITLLARTYPPQGRELDFPIIINLTLEDLEMALAGRYITRVIYLDNPKGAFPILVSNEEQITYDIYSGDPLDAAANQGLPVAIVRLGGRVPTNTALNGLLPPDFCFGSPPWTLNRTIPPEKFITPPQSTIPLNSLTIDPKLKSTGLAAFERQPHELPNAWRAPPSVAGPGGRINEHLVSSNNAGKMPFLEGWTVHNLQPGDTVAHCDTLSGQVLIDRSQRTHIYSPRFCAFRKVEGLMLDSHSIVTDTSQTRQASNHNRNVVNTGFAEQESGTQYARTQQQLRRLDGQRHGIGIESSVALGGYDNFLVVDKGSQVLMQRTFGFSGGERLQLERGAKNVQAWMGSEGTKVQMDTLAPMTATSSDGVASYFSVKIKEAPPTWATFRFIKVASRESAQPGEIVEFTLRFDNLGIEPLGNVTIIDDLTGRLEFLPGTAVSSLKSGFIPKVNTSGSLTLRFEIIDPLMPGEFGIIQFQCRVR